MLKPQALGTLQVALGGFIISFSAVFVNLTVMGPTAVAFYRMLFGGLVLLAYAVITREPLWAGWRALGPAFLCSIFFAGDLIFWHASIKIVGPGVATILVSLQVFFLGFIGLIYFREKLTWRFYLAMPLVIIGLFLLIAKDWTQLGEHYQWGIIASLISALFYAGFTLTLRQTQKPEHRFLKPTVNLVYISVFTCLIFLIVLPFQSGESLIIPHLRDWLWLLTYGVVCQALGWLVISHGLPWVNVSLAGFFLLLQPIGAFIWDVLFFHRPTNLIEFCGAGLAVVAIHLGTTASKV